MIKLTNCKYSTIVMIITVLFLLSNSALHAQIDTTFGGHKVKFADYLKLVIERNLEYAAEKYNVSIAEAEIEIAKVFPDPSLSFGWRENYESASRTGYGFSTELGTTIELGGKRGARIELAENKKVLSQALLDDFLRDLRARASIVFVEALKQKELFRIKLDSYNAMKRLSEAVGIRYKLGSNAEIDETQSRLEAGVLFNELLEAETGWKNSFDDISLMTGLSMKDSSIVPHGLLKKIERKFELNSLIKTAQTNRTDLLAILQNIKVADKSIQVAEKERSIDLDLHIGFGRDFAVPSSGINAKNFTAGISVPLKISNIYDGSVQAAKLIKLQADELYKKIKLTIEIEIRQAFQSYTNSLKQVESFEKGLLENGRNVMNGKIYSYKRGETSLLDVLIAQRTYNDIQTAYYDALGKNAAALIELEKAAGIWDIDF